MLCMIFLLGCLPEANHENTVEREIYSYQFAPLPNDTVLVNNRILSNDSTHFFFENGFLDDTIQLQRGNRSLQSIITTDKSLGAAKRLSKNAGDQKVQLIINGSKEVFINLKGRRNIVTVNKKDTVVKIDYLEVAPIYY